MKKPKRPYPPQEPWEPSKYDERVFTIYIGHTWAERLASGIPIGGFPEDFIDFVKAEVAAAKGRSAKYTDNEIEEKNIRYSEACLTFPPREHGDEPMEIYLPHAAVEVPYTMTPSSEELAQREVDYKEALAEYEKEKVTYEERLAKYEYQLAEWKAQEIAKIEATS